MAQSLIVEYANLLSEHGLGGKAKAFRAEHISDGLFSRRADVLEDLFMHRGKIRSHLSSERANVTGVRAAPFHHERNPKMAKKTASFNKTGIQKLPNDKPVVYRIQTERGKDNYVGIAQRGRVAERLAEHLGEIPGAKVKIEPHASIQDARSSEQRIIKRQKPKYNLQDK